MTHFDPAVHLTPHQLRALKGSDLLLTACPGSGKTRTAAARMLARAEDGAAVAALSFTNVGAESLRHVITSEFAWVLDGRHFVGTIHSFILRYIFYRFAQDAMGSDSAPQIRQSGDTTAPVVLGDNRFRVPLSDFELQPDGSLEFRGKVPLGLPDADEVLRRGSATAREMKLKLARAGMSSIADSVYWSLETLRNSPELAAIIGRRFDELIIDEAQDTSEGQLLIVQLLRQAGGAKSLILVGDPDQSIYEWQGATPERLVRFARDLGLRELALTENHRSSQKLCNVTARFRAQAEPHTAVGPSRNCPWDPELVLYDPKDLGQLVNWYVSRLRGLGIHQDHACLLTRSTQLAEELNGPGGACDPRPLALGRAQFEIERGTARRRDIEAVEKVLSYLAWDVIDLSLLPGEQRRSLRQEASDLLRDAPPLDLKVADWVRDFRPSIERHAKALSASLRHSVGSSFRAPAETRIVARAAFGRRELKVAAQTVHGVKGESKDAVLLVCDDSKTTSRREAQSSVWSRPLVGTLLPDEVTEEIRIAYVALTRAQRFCAVAVPLSTPAETVNAFRAAGFILSA